MGNHAVGIIFHAAASVIESQLDSMSKEEALSKLDMVGEICKANTSSDAEWDDFTNPEYPLGKWIGKCFAPEIYHKFFKEDEFFKDFDDLSDELWDEWYDRVLTVFESRYGFN